MPAIVLASTSPYRRELLQRLQLPFEVCAPEVDETPQADETPVALVRRLSQDKARAAARTYPDALVIGADQVAVHAGTVLGKPGDARRALAQLQAVRGHEVEFYTGLSLLNGASGRLQTEVVRGAVTFRELDDARLQRYLERDEPFSCAGSIKTEALGIALLERVDVDDPTALLGLPLIRLVRLLEAEGVEVP
ncbi:septum formation inhibitor Maf [Ectothiorhodospiraceae bacterium 2226]|nr:septum formation inhibitor Maf [Ectothiorhodospiraceae bacterium 2226]